MEDVYATRVLDHTQAKIVLVNGRGEFTYVNATAERLLGFAPDELIGELAFDYIHPDDRAEVEHIFRETAATDEYAEATAVYRHLTANGTYVWLESRFSNLRDTDLDGFVVSSVDVTERVEVEGERRRLDERLREITATTQEVIWMFSADWRDLLFVNDAYEDLYGAAAAALRADPQSFLEQVHPDDLAHVETAMARLSGGRSIEVEYRVDPGADYRTWVWVHGDPVVEDGEVVRVIGIARDITELNRREQQLRVLDNLLRHNLRNDLNLISGTAELIADDHPELVEETTTIRETSNDLIESAEKGRRIIELLTRGAIREQVELLAAIRESVKQVTAEYPDATVTTTVPGDWTGLAVNEVNEALVELLDNAIRYNPHTTPHVTVTAKASNETVTIEVWSDSDPLPESETAILKGEREMNALFHSSGLGLWLVYWVADLSNGSVSFTQNDADGVGIALTLPLLDDGETGEET